MVVPRRSDARAAVWNRFKAFPERPMPPSDIWFMAQT